MKKLVVATSNQHKLEEIRSMLPNLEVLGLKDIGFNEDIEENGTTFQENALIKAKAIHERFHCAVLADDSGLCIDYLNGEPGVQSARYMGHDTSYDIKNNHILDIMKDVPEEKRGAQFVCAMAYVNEEGQEFVELGICEGRIAYMIEGAHGFGYDPIFYVDQYNTTLANVSSEEKNKISHRHLALEKIVHVIQ